jgi:hypothetical protein
MATTDEFDSDVFSQPFFLGDEPELGIRREGEVISLSANEAEQGIGNGRAVISLRFVMASILIATATATGISILSAGNPVTLFADVTASLADKSASQPSTDPSTPTIQSVAIQSTADEVPGSNSPLVVQELQIGGTSQTQGTNEALSEAMKAEQDAQAPANSRTRKENDEASLETLFRNFQAWNAEQDARDLAKPVQDDPAAVAKIASPSVRPTQMHRRAQTVRNARAEMIRHARERRANVRRQNERVQARSAQDAPAQAQYVQYAEPPSLLERLNPFAASPPQRGP